MVVIKIKSLFLNYKLNFFSSNPSRKDIVKFIQYSQCQSRSEFYGFKREKCFTKIIDISQNNDEIFRKFKKNTKYEINRAKKEGIIFNVEEKPEQFVKFYNVFAESKKRPLIRLEYIKSFKNNLIITKASDGRCDLVMHAYLIDSEAKRVRLMNSASLFRYETYIDKSQLIGMANRYLHFADILFFKDRKFIIYDLGGYDYELKDDECMAINKFKDSFGGDLLEESIYISYPLYAYRLLRGLVKNLAKYILRLGGRQR